MCEKFLGEQYYNIYIWSECCLLSPTYFLLSYWRDLSFVHVHQLHVKACQNVCLVIRLFSSGITSQLVHQYMYGVIVTISHGKAVQTRQTGVQALRLWGYGTRMVQKDPTSYFGNFQEFLRRLKCALHLQNSQHRTSLLLPHLSIFIT